MGVCMSFTTCSHGLFYSIAVLVAKTPEQSDGRFHYFWNGENRLVCVSNAEVVVTYAYDHRGRMVRKDVSRTDNSPFSILHYTFVWDDWNIIREIVREGDSVAITDNIWGLDIDGTLQGAGGVGGLLAVVRDDGVFFPTYDANGNVSEYVTTNGEIVAHYDYSPFGEPLVASGPLASTFTHQFSTKPYCAVTGFSEYQMRKYRPEIGRFCSRDLLPTQRDEPVYAFVNNSCYNAVDYLGLYPCACCKENLRRAWAEHPELLQIADALKKRKAPNLIFGKCLTYVACVQRMVNDVGQGDFGIDPSQKEPGYRIRLLCDSDDNASPNDYETLVERLRHELQHASDNCNEKDKKFDKCPMKLCREIRAYGCSGKYFKGQGRELDYKAIIKHLEETGYFSRVCPKTSVETMRQELLKCPFDVNDCIVPPPGIPTNEDSNALPNNGVRMFR